MTTNAPATSAAAVELACSPRRELDGPVGSNSDDEEDCRICADCESTPENPLIMPCACTAPCHLECLQTWIQTRPQRNNAEQQLKCEICTLEYQIRCTLPAAAYI